MPKPTVREVNDEIYAQVQARILEALEGEVVPWQRPWTAPDLAPRNLDGRPYRGSNALVLSLANYSDPRWCTFLGAKERGGSVRKGEKGTPITFWKFDDAETDADEEAGKRKAPLLRRFYVFNAGAQVDWPEGALEPLAPTAPLEAWDDNRSASLALAAYLESKDAPTIGYGAAQAEYLPGSHHIRMPARSQFATAGGFYSTAFHEAAHSTGHPKLVGRDLSGPFCSQSYGREELIAEIADGFVCATVGVVAEFENSAAYLKSWIAAIRGDAKLVLQAASAAQRAADRILGTTFDSTDDAGEPSDTPQRAD